MKTIKIKLPPLLAYEIYAHTVETGLQDYRGGATNWLKPEEVALYEKIEKNQCELELNITEAGVLHNEIYFLMDAFQQWAEEDGIRWRGVIRSARSKMAELRKFGVKLNERGWAIK